MVNATPIATTPSFNSVSLTVLSIKRAGPAAERGADCSDQRLKPMHVLGKDEDRDRRSVYHPGENVLGRPRVAHREARHGERGHHHKPDAAAEIAAIDRDRELHDADGPRRPMRFARPERAAKEAAPGEERGREQNEPGDEACEYRRRSRQKDEGAERAAGEADDQQRPAPSGPAGSPRPHGQ